MTNKFTLYLIIITVLDVCIGYTVPGNIILHHWKQNRKNYINSYFENQYYIIVIKVNVLRVGHLS
jgi:hypothetical protein